MTWKQFHNRAQFWRHFEDAYNIGVSLHLHFTIWKWPSTELITRAAAGKNLEAFHILIYENGFEAISQ